MALLLTRIDGLVLGQHYYLTLEDECYALREYTTGGGFTHSETNDLISNLKKDPDRRGKPEWKYKERAIQQAGRELREAMNLDWLEGAVLVPMPSSTAKTDAGYDDRLVRVAEVMCEGTHAQVREILVQRVSTRPVHLQKQRRDVDALADNLEIDERVFEPAPAKLVSLDDVLTTGAHVVAAKRVLRTRLPMAHIIGLFVARRAIVSDDAEDL